MKGRRGSRPGWSSVRAGKARPAWRHLATELTGEGWATVMLGEHAEADDVAVGLPALTMLLSGHPAELTEISELTCVDAGLLAQVLLERRYARS